MYHVSIFAKGKNNSSSHLQIITSSNQLIITSSNHINTSSHINRKYLHYISITIVFIGILLRMNVYLQNRSLRIDEANLARNIVEKSYGDFFQSLDYEQYAPPLYSISAKISTLVFGVNEYALRLPALIGGILSLLLLLLLVNRQVEAYPARWYILLLFAFSMLAVRYSSEVKQYSSDTAFTLFFILLALRDKAKKTDLRFSLKWAVLGSFAIWYSMPVIFVLASIGMAFFIKSRLKDRKALLYWIGIGTVWLLNFGIYYYLILKQDAGKDFLLNYHARYFFNFIPGSSAEFWKDWGLIESLFRFITDQTAISITWSMGVFFLGVFILLRKQPFSAFSLLMPIFLCLLASNLHLYSLIERMTLFMLPLFMLFMGVGISFLWKKSGHFRWFWALPMLISIINTQGYPYFVKKMEIEDCKGAMQYLDSHRKEKELIFVQSDGIPAFLFYNDLHDKAWHFEDYYLAGFEEKPGSQFIKKINIDGTFWLFLAHTFPQENIQRNIDWAAETGKETARFETVQASVYRFQRTNF